MRTGYDKQNSICPGREGAMSEIEVCFLDEILLSRLLCPRYMQVMDERSHELGDKMNLTSNTSTNTNAQHSGSACAMTCNQCTCITNKLPFFLAQRGSLWQQNFSVHICPYYVVVAVSTHLPSRILRICGDTSNPGPDQHHGCTRHKRYP